MLTLLDGRQPVPAPRLANAWRDGSHNLAELVDAALSLDPQHRPTAAELARAFRDPTASTATQITQRTRLP
jgi:hypothetical protein